jgi:hypothetical protein
VALRKPASTVVLASISRRRRKEVERQLHTAQPLGQLPDVKCLRAILAVTDGQRCDGVAQTLRVTPKSVRFCRNFHLRPCEV